MTMLKRYWIEVVLLLVAVGIALGVYFSVIGARQESSEIVSCDAVEARLQTHEERMEAKMDALTETINKAIAGATKNWDAVGKNTEQVSELREEVLNLKKEVRELNSLVNHNGGTRDQ